MDPYSASFERHIQIAAPALRVWRALCAPAEVAQWDSGVRFSIDAPANYPQPGQRVRWRTSETIFRILVDEPREVVPERRLRSNLSLGPARFDETYTIHTAADAPILPFGHCLLHMTMTLHIVAVPGRRLFFRHFSTDTPISMEYALEAIKNHSEEQVIRG